MTVPLRRSRRLLRQQRQRQMLLSKPPQEQLSLHSPTSASEESPPPAISPASIAPPPDQRHENGSRTEKPAAARTTGRKRKLREAMMTYEQAQDESFEPQKQEQEPLQGAECSGPTSLRKRCRVDIGNSDDGLNEDSDEHDAGRKRSHEYSPSGGSRPLSSSYPFDHAPQAKDPRLNAEHVHEYCDDDSDADRRSEHDLTTATATVAPVRGPSTLFDRVLRRLPRATQMSLWQRLQALRRSAGVALVRENGNPAVHHLKRAASRSFRSGTNLASRAFSAVTRLRYLRRRGFSRRLVIAGSVLAASLLFGSVLFGPALAPVETDVLTQGLRAWALFSAIPPAVTLGKLRPLQRMNEQFRIGLDPQWLLQHDDTQGVERKIPSWRTNYFGQLVNDLDFLDDVGLVAAYGGRGILYMHELGLQAPRFSNDNGNDNGNGLKSSRSALTGADIRDLTEDITRVYFDVQGIYFAYHLYSREALYDIWKFLEKFLGKRLRRADQKTACGYDNNFTFPHSGSDADRLSCLLRTGQLTPFSPWKRWTGHHVSMEEECPLEDLRYYTFGPSTGNPASEAEKAACHDHARRERLGFLRTQVPNTNETASQLRWLIRASMGQVLELTADIDQALTRVLDLAPRLAQGVRRLSKISKQAAQNTDEDWDRENLFEPDRIRCLKLQASHTATFFDDVALPRLADLAKRLHTGRQVTRLANERALTVQQLVDNLSDNDAVTFPHYTDMHEEVMRAGRELTKVAVAFLQEAPQRHCPDCSTVSWKIPERYHIYSRWEDEDAENPVFGPMNSAHARQTARFVDMCSLTSDASKDTSTRMRHRHKLARISLDDRYFWGETDTLFRSLSDRDDVLDRQSLWIMDLDEMEKLGQYAGPKEMCVWGDC